MSIRTLTLASASVALALAVSSAHAGTITSDPAIDTSGNGFGNVENILTLNDGQPGADGTEIGKVGWDGTDDFYTGEADTNSNKTATFEVLSITTDPGRLGLVFNLNDSGGDAETAIMNSIVATFYKADGTLTGVTAVFDDPGHVFPQAGGGVGGNGNPLRIILSPAEAALVFLPGVRIGLEASISDIDNGSDTFQVAEVQAIVPLPPAAWMGMSLLGGTGVVGFLRKRRVTID